MAGNNTSPSSIASPERGPVSSNHAVGNLFSTILGILAETDVFSHATSPSIFIVYAHDNVNEGTAYAWCVHRLIAWLKDIRSRTISDKSPLPLWHTREGGSDAVRNILDHQFCLLPQHSKPDNIGTICSVDKVVVCGSKLLRRYYEDTFTSPYIAAIKESYREGLDDFSDTSVLKNKIRKVVESNCQLLAFHHVLTELAFLELRDHDNNRSVVPVTLDKEDLMGYLPFVSPTDLVGKLMSFEEAGLHRLFFHLLRQLYTDAHPLINRFEECYTKAAEKLKSKSASIQESWGVVYSEIRRTVGDLMRLDGAALRNVIHESRGPGFRNRISEIHSSLKRRSKLLGSLATVPYEDRKDRNQVRTIGTCGWFTSHHLFQSWQSKKTSSLLWVSADPGCGKSVLARHLADNVLPTSSTRTTCYFFFKDDFEDQRNLESAMRCLLHQLFLQKPALLTNNVINRFDENGQLFASFSGLWDILLSVANHEAAGEITCIIDALDECEQDGRVRLVGALNTLYENEESQSSLKFLLTSRPYIHIQRGFQRLENRQPTIHLSGEDQAEVDKISKEVDIVIKAKVEEISADLQLEDESKHLLQYELTRFTNRTYLWVYLVFDVVKDIVETTPGSLRASVRELPQTVEAAYEKILCRSRDFVKARRLLHIVVAAERPLSLQEMATALAIKDHAFYHQLEFEPEYRFRKTVRELCGLFVTIVDSRIYLLHQTAREFLVHNASRITPNTMRWQNSLRPTESHSVIAEICIYYLCFPDAKVSLHGEVKDLVEYAADNWAAHFRAARGMNTETVLNKAVRLCDTRSHRCKEWTEIFWRNARERPSGPTALMIASFFGLDETIRALPGKRIWDVDERDSQYGRSALFWACYNGHDLVVETLLGPATQTMLLILGFSEKSIDINLRDKRSRTPLMTAAANGHETTVRRLLEKGADVEARSKENETSLHLAVRGDQERVTCELLEGGANLEARDIKGRTPLLAAAEWSNEEKTVQVLLEKGADIEARDIRGRTPLLAAAERSENEEILQVLLEKGADIEARDIEGRTSLLAAAEWSHKEKIVQVLLKKGADTEARDRKGRTPLLVAAEEFGNEEIVQVLLEKGADIQAQDENGRTPLSVALEQGHEGIIQQLRAKRARR
ncbi:hypothetical protein GGR52DRAFT_78917 [Hypoxylon sp. FL1284]|nr:hypothetical protein GGR52DRAFT_78917 [Hypoxylon sp. FL1284]